MMESTQSKAQRALERRRSFYPAVWLVFTLLFIFDFLCMVALGIASIFTANRMPTDYLGGVFIVGHILLFMAIGFGRDNGWHPGKFVCVLLLIGVAWFGATSLIYDAGKKTPEYKWTRQLMEVTDQRVCGQWEVVTGRRTFAHGAPDVSMPTTLTVAAHNDVWVIGSEAVGGWINGRPGRGLVFHWNGARWQQEHLPEPPGFITSGVDGIIARSLNDVTLIGHSTNDKTGYLTMHLWNGKHWTRYEDKAQAEAALDSANVAAEISSGMATNWNGKPWSEAPLPTVTGTIQLRKVAVRPGGAGHNWRPRQPRWSTDRFFALTLGRREVEQSKYARCNCTR